MVAFGELWVSVVGAGEGGGMSVSVLASFSPVSLAAFLRAAVDLFTEFIPSLNFTSSAC